MKRFLVSILVPASAAIAVVGSGFSVWYFGDNQVQSEATASISTKNLLQIGKLSDSVSDLKIVLDQTAAGRTKALALKGQAEDNLKDLEHEGIQITKGTTKVTYTAPTNPVVDRGDFNGTIVRPEIKTVITISGDLSKWLTVTGKTGYTVTPSGSEFTYNWAENQTEIDLKDVFEFGYAKADASLYTSLGDKAANRGDFATCEPLNADEYDVMYKAFANGAMNSNIKILTTATLTIQNNK